MNVYKAVRPLFFCLPAELSHQLALKFLVIAHQLGCLKFFGKNPGHDPVKVMGLELPNRVGLAAGLDKNGDYIDALAQLGFGFIEIGTVTPRPQPGNPKPRLFRLTQADAIINRMGFNNKGVAHLVARVKKSSYKGILGINIGKNFDTPLDRATEDYIIALRQVYEYASYVTINISSPNTKNLRELQQNSALRSLLVALKAEQANLRNFHHRYVPLVIKIAPDLSSEEIQHIAELLIEYSVDGVIATNTSVNRNGVEALSNGHETGGLSGAPLTHQSTHVIQQLAQHLPAGYPIIGVGGIMTPDDAIDKLRAGALLVQLYSGLIFQGPNLITQCISVIGQRFNPNP